MEIQFLGNEGITENCINAILRYLQFGERFTDTIILSHQQSHALIIFSDSGEILAIRSGFTSGYSGEGPRGLAYVLSILKELGTEIEEYSVSRKIIEKINNSSFKISDLDKIKKGIPVRPKRLYDYIYDYHVFYSKKENLLNKFPLSIPYAVLDPRLFDLAISFWDSPGESIFTGYRKLEDEIRNRCNLEDHGSKLFQKAFLGQNSILLWPELNGNEISGRANLFIATYSGYRNIRAHREIEENSKQQLVEFMTLNHLFLLEAESVLRSINSEQGV